MMEKYSQDDDALLLGLRDEEAQLMNEISRHMTVPEKTAAEAARIKNVEMRLGQVRSKITEMDLKKTSETR
jgi:hypothetical protein